MTTDLRGPGGGGRYPDFFLVGAPKSGTTSLYSYLRPHPQVFLPAQKEPHFFSKDLGLHNQQRMDLDRYLPLFERARADQRVGEASTSYIYSRSAATEIRRAVPNAQIIVMLRNPLQQIPSMHAQQVFNGYESLSLSDALDAEEERERLHARTTPPAIRGDLLYRRIAKYAEHVERFFDEFGRERVLVIIFDDFVADPAAAYRTVTDFLGLTAAFMPRFEIVNAHKVSRSMRYRSFLNSPPGWARRIGRTFVPKRYRHSTYELLVSVNTERRPREEVPAVIRERLANDFRDEISRLSSLLGRDLSSWLSLTG